MLMTLLHICSLPKAVVVFNGSFPVVPLGGLFVHLESSWIVCRETISLQCAIPRAVTRLAAIISANLVSFSSNQTTSQYIHVYGGSAGAPPPTVMHTFKH